MPISNTPITPFSTEAIQYKSIQGLNGSLPMTSAVQYSSVALTNSTTETNMLTGSVRGSWVLPAGALNWNNGYDFSGIAPNQTGAGKLLRWKAAGTITNTATPTLRIRGLLTNNSTGATSYIFDSTATTMVTITGTGGFQVYGDILVTNYAASGALVAGGEFLYSSAATAFNRVLIPALVTSSFDTTASYTFSLLATWGTASASNTLTILGADLYHVN